MARIVHLTDEAILELAGNRLASMDLLTIEEHLAVCARCRKRCDDLRFAHSVFERLADVGLDEVLGGDAPNYKPRVQRLREIEFPWGWVSAIVLASAFLLVIFFSPWTVPQVSASALLNDAMQSEVQLPAATAFRIQVGEEACAKSTHNYELVSIAISNRCNTALQQLRASKWGHGNPLSARTYTEWHNSLYQFQDQVTKEKTSWEIKTTTDEGEVHEARLEMRISDYHPTKLTLDFEDNEEVNISESTEPVPPDNIAKRATVIPPKIRPIVIDDPIDLLEVKAWTTLYKLGADSGWEGIVVRNDSQVEVEAIVDNEEQRRQFLVAFASLPEIEVKMHSSTDPVDYENILPVRNRPDGDSPGLAEGWLDQQFPDTDAREKYSNETLRLSRQILGRTFFLDRLQQRQQALSRCSCTKDLSKLVASETHVLLGLQANLSAKLEPLIGTLNHPESHALTFSQAQELDTDLGALFFQSPGPDQTALNTRLQEIANLL